MTRRQERTCELQRAGRELARAATEDIKKGVPSHYAYHYWSRRIPTNAVGRSSATAWEAFDAEMDAYDASAAQLREVTS